MYKSLVLFLFLSFMTQAVAERCKVAYLEELEYTDIECQFYMGTAAYRNQVYSVAAAHWNYALESEAKYDDDANFQAMALSTITFLYYQGLGVKEDKEKAVSNWKNAVLQGDFEARRHLGFAYSDKNYKEKDLIKALGWYESIFLLTNDVRELDESDQEIYRDAIAAAEALRSQLSEKQKNKALVFAKSTL